VPCGRATFHRGKEGGLNTHIGAGAEQWRRKTPLHRRGGIGKKVVTKGRGRRVKGRDPEGVAQAGSIPIGLPGKVKNFLFLKIDGLGEPVWLSVIKGSEGVRGSP